MRLTIRLVVLAKTHSITNAYWDPLEQATKQVITVVLRKQSFQNLS